MRLLLVILVMVWALDEGPGLGLRLGWFQLTQQS